MTDVERRDAAFRVWSGDHSTASGPLEERFSKVVWDAAWAAREEEVNGLLREFRIAMATKNAELGRLRSLLVAKPKKGKKS